MTASVTVITYLLVFRCDNFVNFFHILLSRLRFFYIVLDLVRKIMYVVHDITGTCVNASYNKRNNKQYGLQIFIQVNTIIHL